MNYYLIVLGIEIILVLMAAIVSPVRGGLVAFAALSATAIIESYIFICCYSAYRECLNPSQTSSVRATKSTEEPPPYDEVKIVNEVKA